jgi:Macrocin-O-methyltransferase (TylF)
MFDRAQYQARDEEFWRLIDALPVTKRSMVEEFPSFIRRRELARLIAHYELFKNVVDLPGCVVELGVYRGASFFTWAKLMETFCPGDRSRKVFGFDWFEGLQQFTDKDGTTAGAAAATSHKHVGGYTSDRDLIDALVTAHNQDNLVPGIERCRLVPGDVTHTIPQFLEQHPGLRISLLHFDLDLYEPTLFGLKHLYPLVVPGGVVAFDEYGLIPWEGESRAVEDYFASVGARPPALRKFPFSQQPHGYFIK